MFVFLFYKNNEVLNYSIIVIVMNRLRDLILLLLSKYELGVSN